MNQPAEKLPTNVQSMRRLTPQEVGIRRFQLADFERHRWLQQRFMTQYTHLNPNVAIGFLRSVLYQNQSYFLFGEHACALFQLDSGGTLSPIPMVMERWV